MLIKYVQSFDVDLDNRHLHLDAMNTSNLLAYLFNANTTHPPSSFIYNPHTKRLETGVPFDENANISNIIVQQINWLLNFEETISKTDKDLFLVLYLKNFQNITVLKNKTELLKTIFHNLDLTEYFGESSAEFLKAKINSLLIV